VSKTDLDKAQALYDKGMAQQAAAMSRMPS
jgi:hypothetical protein